jgi:hypothetical protein
MAPLSEIIGHLTLGMLASPHCFMTSHIFMSIFIRSGVLTQSFASKLKKLIGNICWNNVYEKDIQNKYKKKEEVINYDLDISKLQEKYFCKFCAINNVFMGLLLRIEKSTEADETTYTFTFAVIDYNKERTDIIGNINVEKFSKLNKKFEQQPIQNGGTVDVNSLPAGVLAGLPLAGVGAASLAATSAFVVAAGISAGGAASILAVPLVPIAVVSIIGNLATGGFSKAKGTGIYEEKQCFVTVRQGGPADEIISEVMPYVYACPTYYKTDTVISTIKKERVHTIVNIRELEKRFRDYTGDANEFPDFKYEYEYDGKYIGYINNIKKKSMFCLATSVTYCTYSLLLKNDFNPNNIGKEILVTSDKSLHVIVPYKYPSISKKFDGSLELNCSLDNKQTKNMYIPSNYGNSFPDTLQVYTENAINDKKAKEEKQKAKEEKQNEIKKKIQKLREQNEEQKIINAAVNIINPNPYNIQKEAKKRIENHEKEIEETKKRIENREKERREKMEEDTIRKIVEKTKKLHREEEKPKELLREFKEEEQMLENDQKAKKET